MKNVKVMNNKKLFSKTDKQKHKEFRQNRKNARGRNWMVTT